MIKNILLSIILVAFTSLGYAADKVVQLTSLDWPPYSSKSLSEQGASVAVAKAAFKAMGYELQVSFYPWSRAIALAKDSSSQYAGYFRSIFLTSWQMILFIPNLWDLAH
jgi:polar amino acid transport system substrate-binding protein